MLYRTQYIKNLFTGEPFAFEISAKLASRLEERRKQGQSVPAMMQEGIKGREFSFFPSYKKVLEIFTENGYTDELMAQILKDFGVPDDFAQKLLEDEKFVEGIKPLFAGITCDGGRAQSTLRIIYDVVQGYYSAKQTPPHPTSY
jgi:hypothetical protein